jgi:hypothetical protein
MTPLCSEPTFGFRAKIARAGKLAGSAQLPSAPRSENSMSRTLLARFTRMGENLTSCWKELMTACHASSGHVRRDWQTSTCEDGREIELARNAGLGERGLELAAHRLLR